MVVDLFLLPTAKGWRCSGDHTRAEELALEGPPARDLDHGDAFDEVIQWPGSSGRPSNWQTARQNVAQRVLSGRFTRIWQMSDSDRLRSVRETTAEEENFRTEPLPVPITNVEMIRRDPVEPEPVGSFIVMVFRVTGYDPDCDGGLLARMEHVDREGTATGWEVDHIGLYPDCDLVVDYPRTLWELSESIVNQGA
jgi:hypothetical protein